MKVLITGGSGFIGTHLVKGLIEAGHTPVVFDKAEPSQWMGLHWICDDMLRDEAFVTALNDIDAVVHLAAIADVDVALGKPKLVYETNVLGTVNLLRACQFHEISRLVLASTVWVYGENPKDEVTEAEPMGMPNHIYTGSKIAQEHLVYSFGKTHGLPYTILRFDIPYGPGMRPNTVFGAWAKRVIAGKDVIVYGSGWQGRCFVHVTDLAKGIVASLEHHAAAYNIFNLGGAKYVTINELAEVFSKLYNVKVIHDSMRREDFGGVKTCSKKAESMLGWVPSVQLEDGIKDYVDSLR